ncbi:MAG: HAD family hydrolase [Clostridia bacterium]|nr:HAD family hydrolase [Clostridia bacterium]
MIKVVLFDLDGTLLPMDQDVFVKTYFGGIAKRLALRGYEAEGLISAIWAGTATMIKNDGKKTNEAVFWDKFTEIYGENARADEPYFDEFYRLDFDKVQSSCGYNPKAQETVVKIKSMGLRVALATNPIFPTIATQKRIAWAGLSPDDFELYTTYENSRYCKPTLEYYKNIIKQLSVKAEDCLMVGNDVSEDMVAEMLGMKVFLLTDCLINKNQKEINVYPNGGFSELLDYIKTIVE